MAKMTIRACMDSALQLLNQYSIAGTLVPLSYNDQADTELRMINLINDAQMTIATTVKPIEAVHEFDVPVIKKPAMIEVQMPDDFNHVLAIYFTRAGDPNRMPVPIDASRYKWIGDSLLLVPNQPAGHYRITYNRYPVRYDMSTSKDTELDNKPDTHEIIPYFVAAMIAVDENPKAYYALYNVWETRLARLGYKPPHAVSTQVEDMYGFDSFGGVW